YSLEAPARRHKARSAPVPEHSVRSACTARGEAQLAMAVPRPGARHVPRASRLRTRRSPEIMTMRIGVPRETKTLEGRVALVPAAAGDLVKRGHEVWVEKGAGLLSGFRDEDYARL